jgi:hypothetical protein
MPQAPRRQVDARAALIEIPAAVLTARPLVRTGDPTDRGLAVGSAVRTLDLWPERRSRPPGPWLSPVSLARTGSRFGKLRTGQYGDNRGEATASLLISLEGLRACALEKRLDPAHVTQSHTLGHAFEREQIQGPIPVERGVVLAARAGQGGRGRACIGALGCQITCGLASG